MNPFIKAAILTGVVALLAIVIVAQLDADRTTHLRKSVDMVTFEGESNRLVGRIGDVLDDGNRQCELLRASSQMQNKRVYQLAARIGEYQKSNLLNAEYDSIKRTYFSSLTDLYLSTLEQNKRCPQQKAHVLLFFYKEGDCPDCKAQNQILEDLSTACNDTLIFAFPTNTDYPFLQLLNEHYKIASAPTIIVDGGSQLIGMQSKAGLGAAIKAVGGNCRPE